VVRISELQNFELTPVILQAVVLHHQLTGSLTQEKWERNV